MTKLYKILGRKLGFFRDSAPKAEFFNPLGTALKCPISIDDLDYRGKDWFVEDIRQYETDLGGKHYFLADYFLVCKDLKGGEQCVKLRIVPGPKAMLLRQTDQMEYNAGFEQDVLNDPSLLFKVDYQDDQGRDVHEEYIRCGRVKIPYQADVKSVGGDAFALKYWDYSREAEIDGVQAEQYLYVEMLLANGYITIWQGQEVDSQCVEVFADKTEAEDDRLIAKALEDVAKAKADLEAEKELVISSQRRVDENTAEETRLTNRIKTALSDGDPQGTAKEYALSLAQVREQLASNTAQLARHKANYEAFAKKVEAAERQVLEAKRNAKELGLELQESEREAKLSGLAENINVDAAGPIGDAMSKMQDRIFTAKAKTAVANDLNQESLAKAKDDESERQAKADAILAEFAKK